MNILGTGLSGLVGSRVVELLSGKHTFENLDISNGVNILDSKTLDAAIAKSQAEVIMHLAAFTDTAKAYQQHGDKSAPAYMVNVEGTKNVAAAAAAYGKYLIHVSTSYVFDGEKNTNYTEDDQTNPIEWYGMTKTWAEEEVQKISNRYAIVRIDRPYHFGESTKLDLLHKVKKQLEEGSLPPQFRDTCWNPTFIDSFAQILSFFSQQKPENGIYHTTTEPEYSDFSFAQWVKEYYGIKREVREGSLADYLRDNARPYQRNTSLSTAKLQKLLSQSLL